MYPVAQSVTQSAMIDVERVCDVKTAVLQPPPQPIDFKLAAVVVVVVAVPKF